MPRLGRIGPIRTEIELPVVECHRQRVITHLRRAVDELDRRVWDGVERIVGGVGVQFYLEHASALLKNPARRPFDKNRENT